MATLPRMNPKHFYDLVIEVAIIRPGPIQGQLDASVSGAASGKEPVSYYHESLEPLLKPILERTLGVPLFQEQMLEMAMRLADFTGAEAEELRRALSFHRSNELMSRVIKKLRAALAAKNFSNDVVENIIAAIQSFALYGFPESHAISFAILAYATAYLKAHHAPEFYASLLNNQPMGFYSSATLIKDGQRHGVKFLPVDVMKSGWDCFIEGTQSHSTNPAADFSERRQMVLPFPADKVGGERDEPQFPASDSPVRLGLRVVKTLSENGAKRLVVERERASFASLEDLKRRARLNKDELRTLAEIGALNCFATHRRGALWEVEKKVREGDLFEGSARVSLACVTARCFHARRCALPR